MRGEDKFCLIHNQCFSLQPFPGLHQIIPVFHHVTYEIHNFTSTTCHVEYLRQEDLRSPAHAGLLLEWLWACECEWGCVWEWLCEWQACTRSGRELNVWVVLWRWGLAVPVNHYMLFTFHLQREFSYQQTMFYSNWRSVKFDSNLPLLGGGWVGAAFAGGGGSGLFGGEAGLNTASLLNSAFFTTVGC